MASNYSFNISLSVLNHLGRNLYRNLITVIGEAVSNSWDADAHNVWIIIDRENNRMLIKDDGVGMNESDFQNKFLKIGYSKRKQGCYKSDSGRPFIGRKGIGKLALLSCASKIEVASKASGNVVVGGAIDNASLDKAIIDDLSSQEYVLEPMSSIISESLNDMQHGTSVGFYNITSGISNTVEYIKKAIALYFRFSLIDNSFNIFVNGDLINERQLSDLFHNTQFVWEINSLTDPFLDLIKSEADCENIESSFPIQGYIASVEKPSNAKIRGTQEKITIDLFVNGRLREKDILRHIPTTRIVENYVYGQIHYNDLDNGNNKDIFTSSREGVISDSQEYAEFLREVERLFKIIIVQWDEKRRKKGNDGDPDNDSIPKSERKAEELFNATLDTFGETLNTNKSRKKQGTATSEEQTLEGWVKQLSEESKFNIPTYAECFIMENLLRKYIEYQSYQLSQEAIAEAAKFKEKEKNNKNTANISYAIRVNDDDIYYLDMDHLANLIDKVDRIKEAGVNRSAVTYKPIRDAVGHTSLITPTAKQQMSIVYENIKARLKQLLDQFKTSDESPQK